MTENMHPVQQARKPKVILDAKGLMYHTYYRCSDGESPLRNADGKTVARYSEAFVTWLDSYFDVFMDEQGFSPIDIIAVWDGGRQYRAAKFPEYKGTRKPFDPVEATEHEKLTNLIQSFLAAVGATQVSVPGVEADDLIAYIVPHIQPWCQVVTVDNDLVQLASDTVTVFVRDVEKDSYEDVPAKYIALYKSIVGDSSDNYPGISGIGPVRFQDMVKAYGWDGMGELEDFVKSKSVQDLQALAAELNDPTVYKMAESAAQWRLSYDLANLHPELCYGFLRKKKVAPVWYKRVPEEASLASVLNNAGLSHLLEKYAVHCTLQYLMIEGDTLDDIFEDIGDNIVAYDYETYDPNRQPSLDKVNPRGDYVNVLHASPTGASFCFGKNLQYVAYMPTRHKDTYNFSPADLANVLKRNPARVAQNNAFEKIVTDLQIEQGPESDLCDTAVMSSHVDENRMSHHLKDLSRDWLGYEQTTYKELMEATGAAGMNELTGEQVLQYGCDDALVTAHLWVLFDLIMMVEGTEAFVYENEFHFTDVMSKAFERGTPIDLDRLSELEAEDQVGLDTGFSKLHGLLSEHCMQYNPGAVDTYMQEITPFLKAKAQETSLRKKLDFEGVLAELVGKEKAKWETLSAYSPPSETTTTEEFIPTPKKVERLLKLAGLERLGMPTSLAASRVTEWLVHLEPAVAGLEGTTALSEKEQEILRTIGKSVKHFKTRDPEGLADLCELYTDLQVKAGAVKRHAEGDDLNTSSDNQMLSLLYLKLGLPIRHRTMPDRGSFRDVNGLAGAPSASDKALEYALAEDALVGTWERAALETLREIKSIETRFRYYYVPYPQWVHEDTGRIHPSFRNCGTNSRRPTSTGPNALQVAKGKIRQIYLPLEEDHILVVPDFNGQELRITASESLDPVLLDAYLGENPKDVHALTASSFAAGMVKRLYPGLAEYIDYNPTGKVMTYECFEEWRHATDPADKDFADAAKWIRNERAKAVNFLTTYCGTASTLSTNLLIPKEEAKELLDSMFVLYPRLQPFQDETAALAAVQGYVRSAFGAVRHASEELLSDDSGLAQRVKRQLINYLSQGTAADILKVVMRKIAKTKLLEETESYVVGPIYDELVCSVPLSRVEKFAPRLQRIMDLTPPGHKVPMVSEFKLGFTWGDLVEIGTDTSPSAITAGVLAAKKKLAERKGEV